MKRILTIISLIITLLPALYAQVADCNVRLHGRALQYAGYHIEVFVYKDFITKDKTAIGVLDVDDNGNFDCQIDLQQTGIKYAFMELGAYKAYIYLESGKDYHLVLPPFKARPDADRFNPFYQQEPIEAGIVNEPSRLNIAIREFDGWWQDQYGANIARLARYNDRKLADKLVSRCDSMANTLNCKVQFFKDYVHYRKAQIYATPRMGNVRSVISRFYTQNKKSAIDMPPYWQTLQMICPNFLTSITIYTDAKDRCRKEIRSSKANFNSICAALQSDTVYDKRTVSENLLLMGIYDGYYSQEISESFVDHLLNSAISQNTHPDTKILAQNILDKKNHLHPGTDAPGFTLMDMRGKEVSLSSLKGRWVYLCFLHSQNFAAVKDMAALDAMQTKYQKDIQVVGIFTDEKSDQLSARMKNAKHNWLALTYITQQSIISEYNIVALPTYYLIDPDGRISLSPAPSPTENLEQSIANQMINYKREIANKGKKNNQVKNIYDIAH
ncbi:MAG: TlpA family protein disulfide reductase [Bacteroidales bacterium]|nr:TlpA family protein disulfide reductase [Bacteroidales bacterium]